MSISKRIFGSINGREVTAFTLENGNLKTEILNYGGIIRTLVYKGTDVVLGRDSVEEYLNNSGYYGALIGRNSNRIYNAEFELNGKTYTLAKNDNGVANLHGGKVGFDKKIWDAETVDGAEPSLILTLESPDGEEGFPGNVSVKVTYTVTSDDSLKIHYEGTTDADTVLNMTNHTYFNLNGHNSGSVDGHSLTIHSSFYTPNTDQCMPYGEIHSVEGTPFDMRNTIKLADGFASDFEQIRMFGGYDHNFILDGTGYRKVATAVGDKSGIIMDCYTDLPGVQLYSGNVIESERVCKDGAVYDVHHAFCLETQKFPNSTSYPFFPTVILRKGEKYDTTSEYKFSC